jgi:HlyD family secretion protein
LCLFSVGKKSGVIVTQTETKVAVDTVKKHSIIETVSASGKIQPEVEVKISSDVSGEIVGLYVKEGQKVSKGDLLIKIKPDIYISLYERTQAALNTSRANLANAKSRLVQAEAQFKQTEAAFKRNSTLYKDKVISQSEFELSESQFKVSKAEVEAAQESVKAAEFNVASAKASVKEAQDNLNRTTISAPVDGIIYSLKVEMGERVVGTSQMQGTEMLRIANLNAMEVNVDVNENDISRVSLGDTAEIEVDAYPNKKFKGVVSEIANSASLLGSSIDQVTNFVVKIKVLENAYSSLVNETNPYPLRPGLSATVEIRTEMVKDIIAIPIQAVTTREDEEKDTEKSKSKAADLNEVVFILEGDLVHIQKVKTGIQDQSFIHVKSGLEEGQQIVIAPYTAISTLLKEASKVKVVDKDKLFTNNKD